jgi:hypothetical protein
MTSIVSALGAWGYLVAVALAFLICFGWLVLCERQGARYVRSGKYQSSWRRGAGLQQVVLVYAVLFSCIFCFSWSLALELTA